MQEEPHGSKVLHRHNEFIFLTHRGAYVSKLTIIGSDNGLSPDRRQAIIWTNDGLLLIGPLRTNFSGSGILIEIHTFPFKNMHLKMSSGKWRPFCLGLNVLTLFGAQSSQQNETNKPSRTI